MALSHTLACRTMTKARPTTVRFPELVDDALDALAEHYALDRSTMLRFLVMEKARTLGLVLRGGEAPGGASTKSPEPKSPEPKARPSRPRGA